MPTVRVWYIWQAMACMDCTGTDSSTYITKSCYIHRQSERQYVLRSTDSYMYVDTYYYYSNIIWQLTDHQLTRSMQYPCTWQWPYET